MNLSKYSRLTFLGIQSVCSLVWLWSLLPTDSYFSVYLVIAVLGNVCLYLNTRHAFTQQKWHNLLTLLFCCLLSAASVLANHSIFWHLSRPLLLLSFLGGVFSFRNILLFFFRLFPRNPAPQENKRLSPCAVFFGSLSLIVLVDLLHLFLIDYPGTLTPDSMSQMMQLTTGVYSNHHPVWHTYVIKFWVELGYSLFGNYNAAAALYHVWQVFFMASCFSYAIVTLYQVGIPNRLILLTYISYLIMPYHIAYSVTMWKDVVFAGAVLLFVTAFYRIFKKLGKNNALNYIIFTVAGIGFGVWRSNGWLALLASFVLSCFFLMKTEKKLLLLWAAAIVTSWAMKGPCLASLDIPQPDLVESLSIPVQQTARAIQEGGSLTEEERELLEHIVDLEEVPDLYLSFISDPIKNEIRSKDSAYFEEHIGEYLNLWINVGLRHPGAYVRAWLDQTKGFWNGGYDYEIISVTNHRTFSNYFDLDQSIHETPLSEAVLDFFQDVSRAPFFQIFFSIGLHVWILAALFLFNLLQGSKETFLTIPVLMIIGTLLVATPVSYEFRYAYSVFTTLPLLIPVTLYQKR